VSSVLPDSPAMEAGLRPGDIVVGAVNGPFVGRDRIREWVMTAPIGLPQELLIKRGDQRLRMSLTPMPEPGRWTDAPTPVKVGSLAPVLNKLQPYRGTFSPAESAGGSCMLFFFATWCAPCKASLPALAEWEKQQKMSVIAITDEDPRKLDEFFTKQKGFFPGKVMTDQSRQAFLAYGVHGTPTFVLIDRGRIKSIKVGYRVNEGLSFE
jgi:thiol-disulfide isomerase/thioredoxin